MAWTAPRTWTAGETVTATLLNTHLRDNLKALGDPWTSYTPTLTGMSLGNGTVSARYILAGHTLFLRIRIAAGTTTTFSGSVTISLPSGVTTVSDEQEILGKYFTSGGSNFTGFGYVPASSSTVNPFLPTSGTNCACVQMSNTSANLGTTGNMSFTGSCEIV